MLDTRRNTSADSLGKLNPLKEFISSSVHSNSVNGVDNIRITFCALCGNHKSAVSANLISFLPPNTLNNKFHTHTHTLEVFLCFTFSSQTVRIASGTYKTAYWRANGLGRICSYNVLQGQNILCNNKLFSIKMLKFKTFVWNVKHNANRATKMILTDG